MKTKVQLVETQTFCCEICGTSRGLDRHHIIHKGMGGSGREEVVDEANLITLCRSCHDRVHEGGWRIERSAEVLRVVDDRTGQEVMRRYYASGFDAPSFFALLNRLDDHFGELLGCLIYLDDEQLVEAFRASRLLGKRSWLFQAALLYEAQKRSVYGDRSLEAIARRFEVGLRTAQKYALVWRLFFAEDEEPTASDVSGQETEAAGRGGDNGGEAKNVNVDVFSLEEASWYLVAATESPDPKRWLSYAQDRKAENPGYSVGDFRADIQAATGASVQEMERDDGEALGSEGSVPWDCPWVKPYCTRSGRPVPVNECDCDHEEQA